MPVDPAEQVFEVIERARDIVKYVNDNDDVLLPLRVVEKIQALESELTWLEDDDLKKRLGMEV